MSSELRNTGERYSIFTKSCEDSSFWKRVSIGMSCRKTIPDVDEGFGDRTPACREKIHPRAESDIIIYAAIPIGPVLQVDIIQFLGTHGIEIQIPSTTTPNRNSWVVTCRRKNRYVDELHLKDPGHNPSSSELPVHRSIAKENEPCSIEMEQSSIEETHATQFEIQTRKWDDIPGYKFFNGDSLQAEISKLVMVRHYDQDERETDGAVHWNSMVPKLRKPFQKSGGRKFSDTDWLQHIYEGSNTMRFQYCMNSKKNPY